MSSNNNNINNTDFEKIQNSLTSDASGKKEFTIRDAWEFLRAHWIWFLLSVLFFGFMGYVYVKVTPKQYYSYSSIYVNEEYSRGLNTDITTISSSNFMRSINNVDNEIYMLQSRSLMYRVVSELNANISYFCKAKLREVEIYSRKSPVQVIVEDNENPFEIRFTLHETGYDAVLEYHLSKKERTNQSFSAKYGETVTLENIGAITVNRGGNFKNYLQNNGDYVRIFVSTKMQTTLKYLEKLNVSRASKMTSIVYISLVDPVADKAAEIINCLTREYNYDAIRNKQETATRTLEFIDERLQLVGAELSSVDSNVAVLKKKNETINLDSEGSLYIQTVSKYRDEAADVEIQILLVDNMRHLLDDFSGEAKLLPANIGIQDADLNASINQYNQSVLQLMRYGGDKASDNPVVKELRLEIASQQDALSESMTNIYQALIIRRDAINRQINLARSKVVSVPDVEKEGLSIVRNQAILAEIYSFLLNRREETGLQKASTESIAKIVDPALPSTNPVSPKKNIIMLIFILLGLGIPALVIFLRECLRIRIDRINEIENALKVPIIGALPSKDSDDEKIVTASSRDKISEAFRMIRTNLDLTMPKGGQVISVTSSISGEGKSFVSINLALSLAISGKRVILMDMDLRKASLAQKISGKRQPTGLVNFLAGKDNDIHKFISKDEMPGVDVVYVGVIPPNPAELLLRDNMREAFDQLRKDYDYIILDVSPVGLVTDAMILNKFADLTLYVVRIGHSFKRSLDVINSLYYKNLLNGLTVIITDSEAGFGSGQYNSYGYGYGYIYGYGYGYGESETGGNRNVFGRLRKRMKRIKKRTNKSGV